ncbi:MAG: hypothetical protein U1F36_08605 [Planctomycetota bacterium]
MATQKGKDAFAFVKEYLEKKRDASFAEVRDAGKAAGHKIYPIVFGRAQLLLGHVKAGKKAARVAKKTAKKGRANAAPAKAPVARRGRKPGRPAKVQTSAGLGSLDAIVQHVRGLERERDQLRAVIEKLRALLGSI